MSLIRRPLVFLDGVLQAQVVDDRNPDVIIFAFVSNQHQPDTHPLSGVFLPPTKTSKMSSSSNIIAMKKVVQQLRFEASINRVKVIMMYFCLLPNGWGESRPLLRCANTASCRPSLAALVRDELTGRALLEMNWKFLKSPRNKVTVIYQQKN